MDEISILRLFDEERQRIPDDDITFSSTRYLVRAIDSHGSWAGIVYSCFPEEETERVITGEIEFFAKLNRGFEWKVYSHDKPANLLAELGRRGFQIGEEEALLIRDLRELPAALTAPLPAGVSVTPVTDENGVNDFLSVEAALWPAAEKLRDRLLATLSDPAQRELAFVAYAGGNPIGCGRLTAPRESRFAGLWGGAVLPDFRGRGVYRGLLAARIMHILRFSSVEYLRVDALPASRPILEKYGFRQIASTWPADWSETRR